MQVRAISGTLIGTHRRSQVRELSGTFMLGSRGIETLDLARHYLQLRHCLRELLAEALGSGVESLNHQTHGTGILSRARERSGEVVALDSLRG